MPEHAHCSHLLRGGPHTDVTPCTITRLVRHHGQTSSCVAVKTWRIRSKSTEDNRIFTKQLRKRLVKWHRLQHPHIAPIISFLLQDDKPPAIILPFFARGNIKDYTRNNPSANILDLLLGIASGLTYMHSQTPPIAHGTLKASNVLITDSGHACISDPGVNLLHVPPYWIVEDAIYVRWLAPELLFDDERKPGRATPAGDIYSFGMTALEVLTSHRPFSHLHSRYQVILSLMNGGRPIRPSPAEAPQLTDAIWAVIQHCWKEEAWKRPSAIIVYAWLDLIGSSAQSCSGA